MLRWITSVELQYKSTHNSSPHLVFLFLPPSHRLTSSAFDITTKAFSPLLLLQSTPSISITVLSSFSSFVFTMKFTPFLTAALLSGAVKAAWTEKCSTTKGCDVVADKSTYTTSTLWFNSSGFKDDVTTANKTVIYGNNDVKNLVVPFPQGFNMTSGNNQPSTSQLKPKIKAYISSRLRDIHLPHGRWQGRGFQPRECRPL